MFGYHIRTNCIQYRGIYKTLINKKMFPGITFTKLFIYPHKVKNVHIYNEVLKDFKTFIYL